MVCILLFLFAVSALATDTPIAEPLEKGEGEQALTEMNKKLTNPVSELWSISFQQNNYMLDIGLPGQDDRWNSNLNFQPVLPVALTSQWNLITRPVITTFSSIPKPVVKENPDTHEPELTMDRTVAFGDTVLMEMLSPTP
jgi:hypothetical protein